MLELVDGGVDEPGGGGGGEGVEAATHEPSPLQTCPKPHTCIRRSTKALATSPLSSLLNPQPTGPSNRAPQKPVAAGRGRHQGVPSRTAVSCGWAHLRLIGSEGAVLG